MTRLAIFDVDGTICDSQGAEGVCFENAVRRVTGRSVPSLDWASYSDPTSSGIVRELLAGDEEAVRKEDEIEYEFVRLLKAERANCPGEFLPLPGVVSFINQLRSGGRCEVAIATGCFADSAAFKLECCGLELDEFPHATSSDVARREDIIKLAATRAHIPLTSAVYFADGPWDVTASRNLGVPMIGIGRQCQRLKTLGLAHVFRDFSNLESIMAIFRILS